MSSTILVLDFGGQYKELIARSVRQCNVYSEIRPGDIKASEIKALAPKGIILTGGPDSVYTGGAVVCDKEIFELGIPVLGICYGMQLMCHLCGGTVSQGGSGEYGTVDAELDINNQLFKGLNKNLQVLMSHNDTVEKLPEGFSNIGSTQTCLNAAYANDAKRLYGVQFHPETELTARGMDIIRNFLFNICNASPDYNMEDYIEKQIKDIREKVGKEKILLALSGGVDSAVCASLLSKAVPGQLVCIFVDHGFMRHNEGNDIENVFSKMELQFIRVNAQNRFLSLIKGVTDPERKRKLIGAEFINVFTEEAKKLGDIKFLAQGTIYPDIIESGGGANAATIKSHHNVGGLPKNLSFAGIIEPLSGLFKNEVRVIGKILGLPGELIQRPPFPGPGLSIRVMGEVTEEKLNILRAADFILCTEITKNGIKSDQYFAVFTDIRTVGVMGDSRTYNYVIAIRAVNTSDFMTCSYTKIPHGLLEKISVRIVNEVPGVSRIVYDITSKPPATIEWE